MEGIRPLLILYAYNILGSYEDAKDITQDAFLKFSQVDHSKIDNPKAYLIRMVVNLSIDQKRRLKKKLEHYPGPWLPEPISTDDPHFLVHRKQILSYSVLVLLEKLDGKQRAVFILKEAFDYDHDEIARVLGITAENSRKILSRAKNELRTGLNITPDEEQMKVVHRYLNVLETGDMQQLEELLYKDISVTSDGGGKVAAFRNIITGIRSVSSLLSGIYRKMHAQAHTQVGRINHQPAIFYLSGDQIVTCQILAVSENKIHNVFFIRNPDKLELLKKVSGNVSRFSGAVRHE